MQSQALGMGIDDLPQTGCELLYKENYVSNLFNECCTSSRLAPMHLLLYNGVPRVQPVSPIATARRPQFPVYFRLDAGHVLRTPVKSQQLAS